MKALQFLTIVLLVLACKSKKTSTIYLYPTIEVSQSPIWINDECPVKELTVRVSTDNPANVSFEADGEVLSPVVQASTSAQFFSLELPTNKHLSSLLVKLNKGLNAPEKLEVPIHYYAQNDTLNFYSANIETNGFKPIHGFFRECWNSYVGGIFHKDKDYFIGYELTTEDKVIGDTLKRSFKLSNVFLLDDETKEKYRIEPDLYYSISIKNYPQMQSRKDMEIAGKGSLFGLGISPTEDHLPSYSLWGHEYGKQLSLRANGCNSFDTLDVIPVILPDWYQIELECPID